MRILIADDHDLLRDTLSAFLNAEPGVEAATVASFQEAVERVRNGETYALILLDFRMPGMRGLTGLRELVNMRGAPPVALLSGHATPGVAAQALELGAAGFIPKTLRARELVDAVRIMVSGQQYRPADMGAADPGSATRPGSVPDLTQRERDVLVGVADGKSNKEIARDLALTEPTIKVHMKTLYRKLKVSNRTQAALAAREQGLV